MPQTDAGATEAFVRRIGSEVRRRRKEAGLSMAQLAEAAGVSLRVLSSIEHGDANPSLVTISRIAHGLGTEFSVLASPGRADALVVHAPGATPGVWSSPMGSRGVLLVASTLRPSADLWEWTLAPGDSYEAEADPPGSEELFFVLSGTLTLVVDGESGAVLAPGAAARLATDRGYGYRNDGSEPTRFLRVAHVTYARSTT